MYKNMFFQENTEFQSYLRKWRFMFYKKAKKAILRWVIRRGQSIVKVIETITITEATFIFLRNGNLYFSIYFGEKK